jgi:hypothetical protein
MKKVRRLRAMGSRCRQQAAYNPAKRWKLIAEAEYWERLADAELSFHFKECNSNRVVVDGWRSSTIAAAWVVLLSALWGGMGMLHYRAYLLDKHSHVITAANLYCADEQAARERAEQLADANDVELWQLDRRIAIFKSHPRSC